MDLFHTKFIGYTVRLNALATKSHSGHMNSINTANTKPCHIHCTYMGLRHYKPIVYLFEPTKLT